VDEAGSSSRGVPETNTAVMAGCYYVIPMAGELDAVAGAVGMSPSFRG
jgi:hypothetical protein